MGSDYRPGGQAPTIRTARQTTGAVAGTGSADVTVTFSSPFDDTNYTVTASIVENDGGESLRVRRIRTVAAGQVVVNVVNGAITSRTGIVHVIAVHD